MLIRFHGVIQRASTWPLKQIMELCVEIKYWFTELHY